MSYPRDVRVSEQSTNIHNTIMSIRKYTLKRLYVQSTHKQNTIITAYKTIPTAIEQGTKHTIGHEKQLHAVQHLIRSAMVFVEGVGLRDVNKSGGQRLIIKFS